MTLSPGLDFETKIIAKRNMAEVLRRDLAWLGYAPRLLNIGSNTDCYQPVERELRLTRQTVEVLQQVRHPFSIITKSAGIERDLDLLVPLAHARLAAAYITITTLDDELARKMEPRAASPQRRLRTIRTLAERGVPVGVSVAPQIPFVNEDMEQVLQAAWDAAFYTVIRLLWELSPLFRQWLDLHYPQCAARIMSRIQEMRGGRDYDSDFASRMKGSCLWAGLIRQRFEKTCQRLGFNRERVELDLSQFRPALARGQSEMF